MSELLGTAQWEEQALVAQRYPFAPGKFWLGRAKDATAIGYRDDRHICLVSGTRGGKGTSIIVNNLCCWPGSAVVVDPKGENATVTAARRGQGSEHCTGMGQAVHVLDPFSTAHVDERYLSCFNPLDALDPQREETIDEASRLANAIVVVKDDAHDPMWDESARTMVRGLILHVLTATEFTDDERNLITVRTLISRGEWRVAEAIRELGHDDAKIDPPHLLLWRAMELNPAFDGIVAGTGSRFRSMMVAAPKTFEGVLQSTAQHTEFFDSPGIRRVLAKSDFKLSELKTRPEGMTLYLSLPQRYMETHYRWLRMMVALTTTEMEITRGQPASGYPILMVLDEFAGLKRMTAIENAVAQIAGFGVKLVFVLQSLEQLKNTYKDNWETFLSNTGLKVFFSIEDHFTREYISKLAGETEIIRELRSMNESRAENKGYSETRSESQSLSRSTTDGTSVSQTDGSNDSTSRSRGASGGASFQMLRPFFLMKPTPHNVTQQQGWNSSESESHGTSRSHTRGASISETHGTSTTSGTSKTFTRGSSTTAGTGRSESLHHRPLIQPDEVGRDYARIDDRSNPRYPGVALVMITGANPFVVQRMHYFEEAQFIDCFSPHPDHKFVPAVTRTIGGIRPLIETLEAAPNGRRLTITKWFIEPGSVTIPGQPAATIERVPRDNRAVHIAAPYFGKVTATAATGENRLSSAEWRIPDGLLFAVKTYDEQDNGIDPFFELREACRSLEEPKGSLFRRVPAVLLWAGLLILLIAGAFLLIHRNQLRETERIITPEIVQPRAPERKTASTSTKPASANAPAPIKARPAQPDTQPNDDTIAAATVNPTPPPEPVNPTPLSDLAPRTVADRYKSCNSPVESKAAAAAEDCLELGLDSEFGRGGFPQNQKAALNLFEAACLKGSTVACTKATDLVSTNCDAGKGDACEHLAYYYLEGKPNIPVDARKALELLKKACTMYRPSACGRAKQLEEIK